MLKVEAIPVGSVSHPPPKNEVLPTHEFTFGIVAPPGSGKTNLICNLLLFYKKYFHNIVVVSPSINK
jgi:Ni2+-binding GTPase involved in maturation of urease and hydrogenase